MNNQGNKSENFRFSDVYEIRDSRGVLKVLQGSNFPFAVKRIFWITDVPKYEVRGKHGHFETQQLLFSILGKITLEVIPPNGFESISVTLNGQEAFYLPPGHWVSMAFSTPDDILMVAADRDYDPTDVFLEPLK
jgi:hypothetical protein